MLWSILIFQPFFTVFPDLNLDCAACNVKILSFPGVPIQLPMINMFSQDGGNALMIKSMRKDASDTYSCVASNIVGQAAGDTKIEVLPPG